MIAGLGAGVSPVATPPADWGHVALRREGKARVAGEPPVLPFAAPTVDMQKRRRV